MPTIASGELTISGSWEYSPSVQYRTGPTCDSTVKYDQTVFIRGYRIRERPILAPKVIQAAAEPRAPGSKDRDLDPDAIAPDLDTTELEYVPDDAAVSELFYLAYAFVESRATRVFIRQMLFWRIFWMWVDFFTNTLYLILLLSAF